MGRNQLFASKQRAVLNNQPRNLLYIAVGGPRASETGPWPIEPADLSRNTTPTNEEAQEDLIELNCWLTSVVLGGRCQHLCVKKDVNVFCVG